MSIHIMNQTEYAVLNTVAVRNSLSGLIWMNSLSISYVRGSLMTFLITFMWLLKLETLIQIMALKFSG